MLIYKVVAILAVGVICFALGVGWSSHSLVSCDFFKIRLVELLNFTIPAFIALIVATIVSDNNSKTMKRRELLDSLLSKLGDILESIDLETTLYQEQDPQSPWDPAGRRGLEPNRILVLLKKAGMFVSHLDKIQKDFGFLDGDFVRNVKENVSLLRKLISDEPFGKELIPKGRWKNAQALLVAFRLEVSKQRMALFI